MGHPQVRFESVDTKSCLPTLPIPNRPPFAVRVEIVGPSELRVHLQQLPDAYPPCSFEITVAETTLHLIVIPKEPIVDGGSSCDTVVRITDVPAGSLVVRVERRNPGIAEAITLGTGQIPPLGK